MKEVLSIIGVIIGFLLVKYANWIVNEFGHIAEAETWFRMFGGSRMFWKLLGILIILISFLTIAGLMEPLLFAIFGRTIQGLRAF